MGGFFGGGREERGGPLSIYDVGSRAKYIFNTRFHYGLSIMSILDYKNNNILSLMQH